MIGEGEQTFCELAACYENFDKNCEKELLKVRQICFRSQTGEIVATPYRELMNMDELPLYIRICVSLNTKLSITRAAVDVRLGAVIACHPCRARCVSEACRLFCGIADFLDAKVPQVKFVDRTFNCNHERTLALLHFLRTHDNGVTNFTLKLRRICSMKRNWRKLQPCGKDWCSLKSVCSPPICRRLRQSTAR